MTKNKNSERGLKYFKDDDKYSNDRPFSLLKYDK